MRGIRVVFLAFVVIFTVGYAKPDFEVIDSQKNAYIHNNYGLVYAEQGNYFAAVQEFKMAIDLNPGTQATAVYYNNLGNIYYKLEFSRYAAQCFENARTLYPLNVEYYRNLAKAYKQQGILNSKINKYSASKNILDKVLLGFMYLEAGNKQKGVVVLDSFCMTEPDLLITGGVKYYINKVRDGTYYDN
ncbi:tetratricopeptide repeat protein [bacterium]|nr:tetratricopeptide repeat protein [bacterium]